MSNDSIAIKPQGAVDAQSTEPRSRDPGPYRASRHENVRIMANGNAAPAPPSLVTPKVATQLARKRARDRRAQQAMRDRNKGELQALKGQVAYLSQLLSAQAKPVDSPVDGSSTHADEVKQLQLENERLHHELVQARELKRTRVPIISLSIDLPSHSGLIIEPSILQLWSSHISRASASPPAAISEAKSKHRPHSRSFILSDCHDIPWHVGPTCPADRIMQPFCEEQRRIVRSSTTSSLSPGHQQDSSQSDIQTAISKVAADVLSTYSEIDTLPKKVACLYMISSVLNV